ncbi:Microtubule-associated protein futsch [Dirofilaria immitis]
MMETIRNNYDALKSFILAIIEWRSAAAAPYLMFINSVFWWSVFYLDKETQLRLLISCAAAIFSWDILLSPSYERSILFHIFTWPMRSVLRTTSVVMALSSAHFVYWSEFEKACWTAYSAVALLMINPVWLYYQIPQKINKCFCTAYITTKYVAEITVVSPICSFYKILEYIITLRWLLVILEKVADGLLRIKTAIGNVYVATIAKFYAGKNAVLNVINSTIFNTKNFTSRMVYEFRMGIRNGIMYAVTTTSNTVIHIITTTRNRIVYAVTTLRNGIVSAIMSLIDGVLSGSLTLKNGVAAGILRLKNCLIMGFRKSGDIFYFTVIAVKNYIRFALITLQNSVSNFFSAVVQWIKTKIIVPVQNAAYAVIQFLRYWLCAHWWPNFKSWFALHVMFRLQMLFNYFCFGIAYVSCGYWVGPFVAFLSKYFKYFYGYFQLFVLNPIKIWIRRQIDKALTYIKQMLHNLAIGVRDSILWPFCILLISLMNKVCAHLYRLLLQPVVDVLYKKYKVCEDYLLIYCLGPVCKVFVDHIPDRSPFCDDTDTELADLLPPGFNEEESDAEETSDKPSLPSRSLTPLTEDERDFVRGLKFPNLDTSDSSEAEFALKPKLKSQKLLRKKRKAHPKDPAPSACNDELIRAANEVQKDENKREDSSSTSHSGMTFESVASSSAQNGSDDADLQNLDALNFESEDRLRPQFLGDTVEIQRSEECREEMSNDRKQEVDQKKIEEIEICTGVNTAAFNNGLDGSFEVLDK